jgi:ABC-2 type transport system permease protein
MRSRAVSLAILYIKSSFSISLPKREELKKPKTLAKTIGIGLGIILLLADFAFIFVMMNLTMYDGLKPAGLQGLMLLNAATTASVLVFILAFMMALSMFSMAGIESGFLVLPFTPRELLAAKMTLVYATEAVAGAFVLIVAMVIYGIREGPPLMFYLNGLLTALVLPLLPTAISYLILIPLMKVSKVFRSKTFIFYVGGFIGMAFALGFNLYIQSALARLSDPSQIALFADPDSFISRFGRTWIPSWLAWKALSGASSITGFLAVAGNAALGLAGCAVVVGLLGKPYVQSLQAFSESTFSGKKLSVSGKRLFGRRVFVRRPAMLSLLAREVTLMNREPMYLMNGPFVLILMPLLIAIVFIAQRSVLEEAMAGLGPLLAGPGTYLIPAAMGAFLGSSTSIACTAVSRDAKALPWVKSLPITPLGYFYAKLLHAELFTLLGTVIGCAVGAFLLAISVLDILVAAILSILLSTALNMVGLWLDTAFPRLRWDNPIAAMKQNVNAVVVILGAMGSIGGLAGLSLWLKLPRYGYALLYGGVLSLLIAAWLRFYPAFARKRYRKMEA